MLRALQKRAFIDGWGFWRDYAPPTPARLRAAPRELGPLLAYAGPLSAIVLARLAGFTMMQSLRRRRHHDCGPRRRRGYDESRRRRGSNARTSLELVAPRRSTAAKYGTRALAAYQCLINGFVLFAFFAEPLSQTGQTLVPPLVDDGGGPALRGTLKNLATLAAVIGPVVAAASTAFLVLGAPAFVNDAATIALVRRVAFPAVFATTLQLTLTTTLDGCLVGSRDFGWIMCVGSLTAVAQVSALRSVVARAGTLPAATGLSLVFGTFVARLAFYAVISSTRILAGGGPLGRALRRRREASGS